MTAHLINRDPSQPIEFLIIHHYGGTPPEDRETLLRESLADGFADIPYEAYVTPDGRLITGRSESAMCAANLGLNLQALAICLGGNFDAAANPHGPHQLPTDAQLVTAASKLGEWHRAHPMAQVILHRDVSRIVPTAIDAAGQRVSTATACPGSRFIEGRYGEIIWKMMCGYSLDEARADVS